MTLPVNVDDVADDGDADDDDGDADDDDVDGCMHEVRGSAHRALLQVKEVYRGRAEAAMVR